MKAYLVSGIRYVVATGGGYVGATQEDITQMVGLFASILMLAWSMFDKWLESKAKRERKD